MAIDWTATLQDQADFVTQIAADVAQTLDIPNLSATQAARLYRVVEQGAQTFDRILEEMDQHDLDDELSDAADTIADTWANLSIGAANKLRTIQGLEPIEITPEDGGNV
jgi:hypothetical protein